MQSLPYSHSTYSAPGPPSSHSLSLEWKQSSLQMLPPSLRNPQSCSPHSGNPSAYVAHRRGPTRGRGSGVQCSRCPVRMLCTLLPGRHRHSRRRWSSCSPRSSRWQGVAAGQRHVGRSRCSRCRIRIPRTPPPGRRRRSRHRSRSCSPRSSRQRGVAAQCLVECEGHNPARGHRRKRRMRHTSHIRQTHATRVHTNVGTTRRREEERARGIRGQPTSAKGQAAHDAIGAPFAERELRSRAAVVAVVVARVLAILDADDKR